MEGFNLIIFITVLATIVKPNSSICFNEIESVFAHDVHHHWSLYYQSSSSPNFKNQNNIVVNNFRTVLSDSYTIELNPYPSRFDQSAALIILPAYCLRKKSWYNLYWIYRESVVTFQNLFMLPSTLVLLIIKQDTVSSICDCGKKSQLWGLNKLELKKFNQNTPAYKIVFNGNLKERFWKGIVICNIYCTNTYLKRDYLSKIHPKNLVLGLHKFYFYKNNNRKIFARMKWIGSELFKESVTKEFVCEEIFQRRQNT